jgi:peptidoglycan/LPS O-acetylase OafA/YrhL
VRCVAIFAVLWHHTDIPFADKLPRFFARGFLGVDLFFVLSGFLIVTLLLREKNRSGRISLRKFYMRRTLRIFPPYYGLLALLSVVYIVLPGLNTSASFFDCLPFYLTYTSNWSLRQAANLGIMWSLAAEEQFYVAWPAVEKYLRAGQVYLVLAVVVLINQLINFGVLDGVLAWLYGLDRAPPLPILDSTFTPIALGVVVAHVLDHPQGFAAAARWLGQRNSAVMLLLLLLSLVAWLPADLSGWPRLSLHVVMAAWLTSLVVREDNGMRVVMTARPVAFVGAISYGMYLYHLWVFHVVGTVCRRLDLTSALLVFALEVAATVAVAAISYQFYERKFLKLKDHFNWAT